MPYYICNPPNCGHIKHYAALYVYSLSTKKCPKCTKAGLLRPYDGPIADVMLDSEDAKALLLKPQVDHAKTLLDAKAIALDQATRTRDSLQHTYNRKLKVDAVGAAADMLELTKATALLLTASDEYASANAAYLKLEDAYTNLGQRAAVRKDSPVAFKAANEVQQHSGKNKLYIGSRQYVSNHARSGPKKHRILDVPNWSPGLNVSWVEGGIRAKANFKFKLDSNDPRADVRLDVLQKFKDEPNLSPEEFFAICKAEGSGSILWYDRDGAARPTWTALEIWCLLRAGYTFTFGDSRKDGAGRKIVLIPPV